MIVLLPETAWLELGYVLGGIRREDHVLSFEGDLRIDVSQTRMEGKTLLKGSCLRMESLSNQLR